MFRFAVCFSLSLLLAPLSAAQLSATQGRSVAAPKVSAAVFAPTKVVDPSGAGDYTEIADAVAAAAPDTLILVRAGVYTAPVVIDDQSVKVFADDSATVRLTQPILVQNLGPQQSVTLSGLVLEFGFEVTDCAGLVRLQDCSTPMDGPLADLPSQIPYWEWHFCGAGGSRQVIANSQAVTLVGCDLIGADGAFSAPWDGGPGDHGLWVIDSTVALYDCRLEGGNGESCGMPPFFNVGGGAGGDALHISGSTSRVHYTRMQFVTGMGGYYSIGTPGEVSLACDGLPIRAEFGVHLEEATHAPLAYRVPAVLRSGEWGWHTASGPAGNALTVVRSRRGVWAPLGSDQGIRHLPLSAQPSLVGHLLSDGSLHRPFAVQGPPTPAVHVATEMQVFSGAGATPFWSEPRLLVVVHPSL